MYVCKAKTDIFQFFLFFYAPFPKTKVLILLVDLSYFAHTFAVFCSYFCWRSARILLVFLKKMSSFAKLGTLTRYTCKGCYRGCAVGRPAEYVVSEVEGELGRRLGLRPQENMHFWKIVAIYFFCFGKMLQITRPKKLQMPARHSDCGWWGPPPHSQWDRKRNLAMRTWRSKAFQWGKKRLLSKMRTHFRAFADLLVVILIKIPQGL